jgi:hypothetical protein
MKVSITILFLLGMSFLGHSQYTHWNNAYDLEDQSAIFFPQKLFVRDSIIYSFGSKTTPYGVFARKTDLGGQIISTHLYDLNYPFYVGHAGSNAETLIELADGSMVLFESPVNTCESIYPALIRFDNNLDTLWHRKYPVTNSLDCLSQRELGLYSACPLPDTTFMALGLKKYINLGYTDSSAIAYIHFDSSGNILNYLETQMSYADGPELYRLVGTRYEVEENILLSWGQARPPIPGMPFWTNGQALLLKTDLEGNIIDSLHFGSANFNENSPAVEVLNDHKAVLFYDYILSEAVFPQNGYYTEPRVVLIDTDSMSVIWEQAYTLPQYENIGMAGIGYYDALVTSDNKYVACFSAFAPNVFYETGLMKVDSMGNLEWMTTYFPPVSVSLPVLFSIDETPDGGYVATGVTQPSESEQKQWMLKIDACGYEEPNGCPPVVSINESEGVEMQIWPNPFHSSLKAILPVNAEWIIITDGTGRRVKEERIYYPHQQWNLSDLENGVYILNVLLEDGRVVARRVVKQ